MRPPSQNATSYSGRQLHTHPATFATTAFDQKAFNITVVWPYAMVGNIACHIAKSIGNQFIEPPEHLFLILHRRPFNELSRYTMALVKYWPLEIICECHCTKKCHMCVGQQRDPLGIGVRSPIGKSPLLLLLLLA